MEYIAFIEEWLRRRLLIIGDGLSDHLLGPKSSQAVVLFRVLNLDQQLSIRQTRDLKLDIKREMRKLTVEKIQKEVVPRSHHSSTHESERTFTCWSYAE